MVNGKTLHFRARRSAVYATNGMVACSQPLASGIGLRVLQGGGNAIDAAVAIGAALNLTEGTLRPHPLHHVRSGQLLCWGQPDCIYSTTTGRYVNWPRWRLLHPLQARRRPTGTFQATGTFQ
jgi:hypothetical protein